MEAVKHVYEVRPRSDHRGVAAISDALPFIIALPSKSRRILRSGIGSSRGPRSSAWLQRRVR